jgi:hypothetical protein
LRRNRVYSSIRGVRLAESVSRADGLNIDRALPVHGNLEMSKAAELLKA